MTSSTDPGWLETRLRQGLVLAFGLLAIVGATGFTEAHLFHRDSVLKYLLTSVAPLFLGGLFVVRRPLLAVTWLTVVVAPFSGFAFGVSGVELHPLIVLLPLAFLLWAMRPARTGPRSHLLVAGIALCVALVLPVVESHDRLGSLSTIVSLIGSAVLVAEVTGDREGRRTMVSALVVMAGVQAVIAIYEKATGHQLNLYGSAGASTYTSSSYFFDYGGQTRPPGSFYDPISLGNALAISLPVGLALAVEAARLRRWASLAVAIAALGVIVVALELTLSRMSWIAGGVGMLTAAAFFPPTIRRFLLPLFVELVIVLGILGVFSGDATAVRRLSSTLHPLDETGTGDGDRIRVEIWGIVLRVIEHHPIAGIGLDRVGDALSARFAATSGQSNAQSTYLQAAAEGGLLLAAGIAAVLLGAVRDLRRAFTVDRVLAAALLGSLVAMLICWITDVTIRYSAVAVIMGAIFGFIAGAARPTGGTEAASA